MEAVQAQLTDVTPTSAGIDSEAIVAGFAGGTKAQTIAAESISLTPEQVIGQVGTVTPAHYAHARSLLAKLPASLREQIHQPQAAIATLYALFLEPEPGALQTQQL
jgi:hypothetical protein